MTDEPIFGSPWPEVKNWLKSLGTAFPLPKPNAREITADEPYEHGSVPPLETPFRERLFAAQHKEWVRLDGRLLDDPFAHRRPPMPFESKHHERMGRCKFDIFMTQGGNAVRNHRFLQRKAQRRRNREAGVRFWWGRRARMRLGDEQFWRLSRAARECYLDRYD